MHCLRRWGGLMVLLGSLFSGLAAARAQVELPELTPVRFSGDQKEVRLPADVDDLVVAAGGRYLILKLEAIRHLIVFDTVKAEIIKYLSLPSRGCFFAAGARCLVVLSPEKKTIERWDLTTFKREQVVPVPFPENVVQMAMGHASPGPLVFLVSAGTNNQSCKFMDPNTLQLLELQQFIEPEKAVEETDSRRSRLMSRRREEQSIPKYLKSIHPSANGQLVATDYCMMMVTGTSVGYRLNRNSGLPDAAGNLLYAPKSVYSVGQNQSSVLSEWGIPYPAVQPGLFFVLHTRNRNMNAPQSGIVLRIANYPKLLFPLGKVNTELSIKRDDFKVPEEKRFTFIPDAKLLIQVPNVADKLILHKADLEAMLKNSQDDYAYVTSIPPNTAALGQTYQHQLTVNSSRKVKFELTNAPEQMTVSDSGLISWNVPNEFSSPVVPVEVQLEMESALKTKYAFLINISKIVVDMAQNKELAAAMRDKARQERMQESNDKRLQLMLAKLKESGPRAKQLAENNALGYLRRLEADENRKQSAPVLRTWRDVSGNELDAQMLEVFADRVKLKSNSSGEYDIPLNELSAVDQKYIREITAAAREARKKTKAAESLAHSPYLQMRQVYAGLQRSLQELRGRFISARSRSREGEPLLSWRVHLLRYNGGGDLYKLFRHDEPWDSEYNKRLIPLMPAYYRTPNSKVDEGKTNLQVVSGEHCLFKGSGSVGLTEVTDELGQTVMLVEVPDRLAVEWTRPDDWEFTSEAAIKDLFGFHPDGFFALFADGAVNFISSENSLNDISRAFKRDDGGKVELK